MLNTRTVGGHRPRSNAPTPVISVGGTEGRQPGSLFSVQLISRGGTQSSNPSPSSGESDELPTKRRGDDPADADLLQRLDPQLRSSVSRPNRGQSQQSVRPCRTEQVQVLDRRLGSGGHCA